MLAEKRLREIHMTCQTTSTSKFHSVYSSLMSILKEKDKCQRCFGNDDILKSHESKIQIFIILVTTVIDYHSRITLVLRLKGSSYPKEEE